MQNPISHPQLAAFVRHLKYTLGCDVIQFLIAHTSFLDGKDQPPPIINFAGSGDFVRIGDHHVEILIDQAKLQDGQNVLEIGCGIGRNATALARRMPAIRYCGFDIVSYGIMWCQKHFRDKTNFIFARSDIYNSFYNPRGSLRSDQFRFNYLDKEFDIVFATSVFTHMSAKDITHYLAESNRCIKPGGIGYFTCFILDEDSRISIEAGKSDFTFRYQIERAWTEREFEPDVAVAFDESVFFEMIHKSGFTVQSFTAGSWRGCSSVEFQDHFILRRPI